MKISQALIMRKVMLLSALFFLCIVFFFNSCKKDGELVPEFDSGNANIMKTDTFTIVTSLAKEDSIRTDVSIYNLLGIYNDPVFGPTASSFYTQATLNGLNASLAYLPPPIKNLLPGMPLANFDIPLIPPIAL